MKLKGMLFQTVCSKLYSLKKLELDGYRGEEMERGDRGLESEYCRSSRISSAIRG
jgi:hypothetical protein